MWYPPAAGGAAAPRTAAAAPRNAAAAVPGAGWLVRRGLPVGSAQWCCPARRELAPVWRSWGPCQMDRTRWRSVWNKNFNNDPVQAIFKKSITVRGFNCKNRTNNSVNLNAMFSALLATLPRWVVFRVLVPSSHQSESLWVLFYLAATRVSPSESCFTWQPPGCAPQWPDRQVWELLLSWDSPVPGPAGFSSSRRRGPSARPCTWSTKKQN